jgi:protein-arginine deiminase
VPRPFGPVVGGTDLFEKAVNVELTALGLTVEFLDCWHEYHVLLGEVHCATNTLRTAKPVRWWEFEG